MAADMICKGKETACQPGISVPTEFLNRRNAPPSRTSTTAIELLGALSASSCSERAATSIRGRLAIVKRDIVRPSTVVMGLTVAVVAVVVRVALKACNNDDCQVQFGFEVIRPRLMPASDPYPGRARVHAANSFRHLHQDYTNYSATPSMTFSF